MRSENDTHLGKPVLIIATIVKPLTSRTSEIDVTWLYDMAYVYPRCIDHDTKMYCRVSDVEFDLMFMLELVLVVHSPCTNSFE